MRPNLLARIWLSTSVGLTILFALTAWVLQRNIVESANQTLQEEIRASFQAYESLWKARSETLASVAAVLSSHPHVRAAFQTRHRPTIQDTAGELWVKVSDQLKETAFFVVTEPSGATVAALDTAAPVQLPASWPMVRTVLPGFPKQASGFYVLNGELYQLVLTPVYLDDTRGASLSKVLVTGFVVNPLVALRLRESTGDSEFLFLSESRVFASTLNERATGVLRERLAVGAKADLVSDGVSEYAVSRSDLIDLEGRPVGQLCVLRSFDAARERIASMQNYLVLIWMCAVAIGLAISYFLARRIVQPIRLLDRGAAEVARQNYGFRVPEEGDDELGRLSHTFNSMCGSLQAARQELIRQERISTIGRMASSIVHDLRNPLAAIYGGAEMMVDTDLSQAQVKRVASNIYRSSRRIQEMLQDLLDLTRGKTHKVEPCQLAEVIAAGVEPVETTAQQQKVRISVDVPEVELELARARVERVFMNLAGNALEVMPSGGEIRVTGRDFDDRVEIDVADTGPGIPRELREQLFQPFFTHGKKNGLGLGLALSRQTILDHGGDMWIADDDGPGATFRIRLPKGRVEAPVETTMAAQA
ncbi:MAG: HAMP domain-containing sensor histidine kinase [Bryobacteraceae bacterium]